MVVTLFLPNQFRNHFQHGQYLLDITVLTKRFLQNRFTKKLGMKKKVKMYLFGVWTVY
uniref:Uncharacterized protein n=1 Tax=Arundo donax TaxID=35708 RepID=A0A0A9G3N1_ARUDO